MKHLLSLLGWFTMITAQAQRIDSLLMTLKDPTGKTVLVAAHRGDWRNAPENSIGALKNAIAMGVDIVEIDLKKTKDGHLILLHDATLDRTTTGNGRPQDFTLDSLKKLYLRSGVGEPTRQRIPTFAEAMLAVKGQVLVNIDKGYDYFEDVYATLERTQTLNQAIIKSKRSLQQVQAENGPLLAKLLFMPVISLDKPDAQRLIDDYQRAYKPLAIEFIFASDTAVLAQSGFARVAFGGSRVWINSLWASLNGGHDDELAVDEQHPDAAWGWLLMHGATIIQTDRPKELLLYLRQQGRHH